MFREKLNINKGLLLIYSIVCLFSFYLAINILSKEDKKFGLLVEHKYDQDNTTHLE